MNYKHFTLPLLFLSLSSLVISSCEADNGDEITPEKTTFTLSGNANGAQERPNPVTTSGTGTISGNYNRTTNTLTYTINWTGLSGVPNNMHFHGPATVNTAAGVAIGIPLPANPAATGSQSGTATLTDQQESDLLGGLWYYNIHTPTNPAGEIRGQITAQ